MFRKIARILFVPVGTAYLCVPKYNPDKKITLFWDGRKFKNRAGFVWEVKSAKRI
jgi:hypothetical protein